MTTLVVAGAVANKLLNGGEAWVRLSWIRGFQRLGCRCAFRRADRSRRLRGRRLVQRTSIGSWSSFGLTGSATLMLGDRETVSGLTHDEVLRARGRGRPAGEHQRQPPRPGRPEPFARRAYVDLDPGFTQIWHATGMPARDWRATTPTSRWARTSARPGCADPDEWNRLAPRAAPGRARGLARGRRGDAVASRRSGLGAGPSARSSTRAARTA